MQAAYIKYVMALILFGTNGIVASKIYMNSYEIVFWRTLIGSAFLLSIFLITRKTGVFKSKKEGKHFSFVILSGIAMGASWMFLYEAYVQMGVGMASLTYYCGPVIVMGLSPILFQEKMTWGKVVGLTGALVGLLLTNGMDVVSKGLNSGLVFGLFSALMYAFMVIFNKKATTIVGLENVVIQLFFSFVTVAVFLLWKAGTVEPVEAGNLAPLVFLGFVNTGVGCYLYFSSINWLTASFVSIIGYLEPLSALLFSALLLQERLTWIQGLGAVFIIGGGLFSELYRREKRISDAETY
ncbi:EamA family transporter [Alkalibacter rhizosphaerae]|uniref:EamA family transporter n=1 Tax=Alkalibacter rhizosphaerae TaxID=2815577 RepID=A0A974XEN6_9FIRM|nr:DMT family transporter [Alkalibacter rhizosphaerae]QSX08428.1 EamA family transporter [Alkalibacter rhizosphaerae]